MPFDTRIADWVNVTATISFVSASVVMYSIFPLDPNQKLLHLTALLFYLAAACSFALHIYYEYTSARVTVDIAYAIATIVFAIQYYQTPFQIPIAITLGFSLASNILSIFACGIQLTRRPKFEAVALGILFCISIQRGYETFRRIEAVIDGNFELSTQIIPTFCTFLRVALPKTHSWYVDLCELLLQIWSFPQFHMIWELFLILVIGIEITMVKSYRSLTNTQVHHDYHAYGDDGTSASSSSAPPKSPVEDQFVGQNTVIYKKEDLENQPHRFDKNSADKVSESPNTSKIIVLAPNEQDDVVPDSDYDVEDDSKSDIRSGRKAYWVLALVFATLFRTFYSMTVLMDLERTLCFLGLAGAIEHAVFVSLRYTRRYKFKYTHIAFFGAFVLLCVLAGFALWTYHVSQITVLTDLLLDRRFLIGFFSVFAGLVGLLANLRSEHHLQLQLRRV